MSVSGDRFYYILYRIIWIIVSILGVIGILMIVQQSMTSQIVSTFIYKIGANPYTFVDHVVKPVIMTLLIVLGVALIVGFIEIVLVALIGEEIILLISWATPFVFIGISFYLYWQSNADYNYLGGALFGVLILMFLIYFRKKLRVSARLIEKSAEIVAGNPTMILPQLWANVLVIIANILGFSGSFVMASVAYDIHPYLAIIAGPLYYWLVLFLISGSRAFADAHNIAYVNEWYNKSGDPVFSHASKTVRELKGPIAKYAFLMTFVSWFKSRRKSYSSSFTGGSITNLFRLDYVLKNIWRRFFSSSSVASNVGSAVATVVEYIGKYTLVIVVTRKVHSITQAYKESAKTIVRTFIATIGGTIGFAIIDYLRKGLSQVIFIAAGAYYGYQFPVIVGLAHTDLLARILWAIVMAIVFYAVGFETVDIMFNPVTNAFNVLLFNAFTDVKSGKKPSPKLDPKTRELLVDAFKE